MNIILPCLEKVINLLWGKKKTNHKKLTKRYSNIDNSMSEFSSPADKSDSNYNYVEEDGREVFIKPDADLETS